VAETARIEPEQLLARFGLSEFRAGQREAVQAALDGRDSLVVMPTGAGKSLCYQLPALDDSNPARPLVLVVSPLIALMDDQRERLKRVGVRVAMVASSVEPAQNAAELSRIASGEAQIALVAPERFASRAFRDALARRRLSLFVVDEAHCVAEWGHDFRPDYLRLRDAIASLGRPPVMASTATATPRVAREIAERLGLRDPVVVSGGFDRPNICFDVVTVQGKGALARKRAALSHVLGDPDARPAIVYCGTRKDTDSLAAEIARWGLSVVAYHAGMSPQARREAQESFMGGEVEAIVATNAFGMGVDKADVRTVAHWAIPTSLEGYYQEAGRGGRDGLPARALLLAARVDLGRLIRFNTDRDITVAEVRAFVARLRDGAQRGQEGHISRIERGELDDRRRQLLSIAERAGAAVLQPGAGGSLLVELTGRGSPRAAHLAIKAARDRGWEAYRAIERFVANDQVCRRRQILQHFGDAQREPPQGRCCDVCDPDPELRAAVEAVQGRGRRPSRMAGGGASDRRAGADAAASSAGGPHPSEAQPVEEAHFERLRAWRMQRAAGKPAYTVASNAVLEQVLRHRPSDPQELLAIRGVGPAFCAKHGESLMQELASM
jgi:ATP-dependent DNA helicase RecQ